MEAYGNAMVLSRAWLWVFTLKHVLQRPFLFYNLALIFLFCDLIIKNNYNVKCNHDQVKYLTQDL